MLNKLFGSNTRARVLKFFLLKPEEDFYVRQLARELDLPLNSVHRELENLEEIGLLSSEQINNPEDNFVEKEIPEKEEVAFSKKETKKKKTEDSFMEILDEDPEEKKKVLKKDKKYYKVNKNFALYEELKSLIIKSQIFCERDFIEKLKNLGNIYFLVLTGVFVGDFESNVDLLIVGDFKKDEFEKIIKNLEKDIMNEVNYVILDKEDFAYRKEITDVFLYNILEGNKKIVIDEVF